MLIIMDRVSTKAPYLRVQKRTRNIHGFLHADLACPVGLSRDNTIASPSYDRVHSPVLIRLLRWIRPCILGGTVTVSNIRVDVSFVCLCVCLFCAAQAGRGTFSAGTSGWQMAQVSQPRGKSFEDAKLRFEDVQRALKEKSGTVGSVVV